MWIAAWIWACGVSEPPAPAPVEAAAASVYTTGMWRDRVLTVEAGLEEALARSSSSSAAELCRAVYQGSFEPELEPLVRSHIGWTEATTLEYGFGQVEAAPADEGMDEPSQGRTAAPPGPPPSAADAGAGPLSGGPLPGGLKAEDIFTSDYGGVDFDVDKSRKEPPAPDKVEPPSGSEQVRASMAGGTLAAENLDFKAGGGGPWKVKVAIGLIYDFPDIKTLRKSIREKKVTQDDQISHDGKDWTRIGSDAEQEVFFAEVHARLMEETGGKVVEEKPKRKAPPVDPASSAGIEPTASTTGEAHGDAFKVDLKQRPSKTAAM